MSKMRSRGLAGASLALFVTSLTFSTPGDATAQLSPNAPVIPVRVTNSPSLPVNVVGTAAVTGNVTATLAGPVTATLAGPVNATLAGPVDLAPGTTVTVGNSGGNPVLVRDVAGTKQPSQGSAGCFFEGGYCAVDLGTVPAGWRLVVEHVSVNIHLLNGQVHQAMLGKGILGPDTVYLGYPIDHLVPQIFAGTSVSAANHQTLMFFDQGEIVRLQISKTDAPTGGAVNAYYSGYLMPR